MERQKNIRKPSALRLKRKYKWKEKMKIKGEKISSVNIIDIRHT